MKLNLKFLSNIFPVVLFIMLNNMIVTFKSVHVTLGYHNSTERYLMCGTIVMLYYVVLNFQSVDETLVQFF